MSKKMIICPAHEKEIQNAKEKEKEKEKEIKE
jgi:hypothetical protein